MHWMPSWERHRSNLEAVRVCSGELFGIVEKEQLTRNAFHIFPIVHRKLDADYSARRHVVGIEIRDVAGKGSEAWIVSYQHQCVTGSRWLADNFTECLDGSLVYVLVYHYSFLRIPDFSGEQMSRSDGSQGGTGKQ